MASVDDENSDDDTGRQAFNKRQVDIMRNWSNINFRDPYPTRKEKERMAAETKLTYRQVENWFSNWRMRVWLPNSKRQKSSTMDEEVKEPPSSHTEVAISPVVSTPVTPGLLRCRLSDFREAI
ncbi:MAG: hypothetical protein Harvfovirus3_33 [Harvfovirus sp.]|uniref:Homeobox domain-containing protein n=1 Tax=Harvfovirus sp. TaxID=2487768 RepID=A0A3G5A082_9VIRU|nr:MAG: hypothetical protein Harvfovirus3_33 [Harvfovirus sp.]